VQLHYRQAIDADAERINALVNSVYRGESSKVGWTTEADLLGGQRVDVGAVRELLRKQGNAILIAEQSGEIVGCVHAEKKSGGRCYLGMLSVQANLQSLGVGRGLIHELENFAKNRWECTMVEMTVIGQRQELIDYYVRRGYRVTGERREFPMNDPRLGLPKRDDLYFEVLAKDLRAD
jgi:ribosomal protein S18 acetylase RimI-like enzyme